MSKYLAYYLRLSLDDGNAGESSSIVSQRQLIKEYINSSGEFSGIETLEFADDGYSGTNFNRPAVKRLLEAVKKGEIRCIIVKDFSRFGRNYLETSKYIEQIFPYAGVRFIAVDDRYDSDKHKGATAEIDVPVRNMINAMYSVDISKKVKSAKQTKIKQGTFVNTYVAYGYKKDIINRGKLLIDEPAAAAVREIYNLALDGNTTFQIAEILNNEHIPTPSAYRNHTGGNGNRWRSNTVLRILSDEQYTGVFIGGMTESAKAGSNKRIYKPKEEWVRIQDAHPAIITRKQFDTISGMIHRKSKSKSKIISYRPLYKKVRCGKCGHALHYRGDTGSPFYHCITAGYSANEYRCMEGKIREKDLNEAVAAVLFTHIKLFADAVEGKEKKSNTVEVKNLQSRKRKLYERYKNGEINKSLYLRERGVLEKVCETSSPQPAVTELSLTKEMADEFIEVVYVYGSDRITVKLTGI